MLAYFLLKNLRFKFIHHPHLGFLDLLIKQNKGFIHRNEFYLVDMYIIIAKPSAVLLFDICLVMPCAQLALVCADCQELIVSGTIFFCSFCRMLAHINLVIELYWLSDLPCGEPTITDFIEKEAFE